MPRPFHATLPLLAQLSWAGATRQPDLTLLSALGKCTRVLTTGPTAGSESFQNAHSTASGLAQGWAASEEAALQLERRQREAGLDPLLTASAAQRLALLLHAYAVSRGPPAAGGASVQARDMLAAGAQSCASLVALEPANAGFLCRNALALGRLGRFAQAAAMLRRALVAAEESRGEAHRSRVVTLPWQDCGPTAA